jgi:hypothetical protein
VVSNCFKKPHGACRAFTPIIRILPGNIQAPKEAELPFRSMLKWLDSEKQRPKINNLTIINSITISTYTVTAFPADQDGHARHRSLNGA